MPERAEALASAFVAACVEKTWQATTAESCTGGMIAAAITDIPGASRMFGTGFVTYANAAKIRLLGVSEAVLEREGAVSEAVVRAMAEGARRVAQADIGIAVTGIAGPGGGTPTKPVGLVYIAIATQAGTKPQEHRFTGDRAAIRQQSVEAALRLALQEIR